MGEPKLFERLEPSNNFDSFGDSMERVGFVGLGVMGSRMAKRLLDAGHAVTGHNRTKSKAEWLLKSGMKWAETPRAAAEAGEIVVSMVTNTEALDAIANGPDGILAGLGAGKIYIDMSTVSPAASRELAAKAAAQGSRMLDAPVSGSVSTLEEGKLSIMVGGDPTAFERARPILEKIGPKVTHVGTNGLAVTMKIATNLSLAVQMLAFSEGVLLAEKSGIKRETAVEVLLNSVIASPMVKYRGPFVLKMPDEAWFDVNMMQKDLLLALETGRKTNVPLPTTAVTNEMLTAARAMGFADKDFAVLFETLASMAGLKK
jgi:3-hydroxyisobutyrate dehydrogenase-like beta-hydroxyacid dehydrogenase